MFLTDSPNRRLRSAFTLVELLIALTIASVLTALALPTLKEGMRQNTLSRSASLVKGAFLNARTQAIRTGRPYGVVLQRQRPNLGSGNADTLNFLGANYASRIYYVQSPIEYRGDMEAAAAYPFFDTTTAATGRVNNTPFFFFPQSAAGILYASAANTGSPARKLIDVGTKFSVKASGYCFEIVAMRTTNGIAGTRFATTPGTIVEFNYGFASPQYSIESGEHFIQALPADVPLFPHALNVSQPYGFKFQVKPLRAPLAPVSLVGKCVVDLSISGPASDPLAFNTQEIVDEDPSSTIPPLQPELPMDDIIVMFAADGRLDGIYLNRRVVQSGNIVGFQLERIDPATTVSFCVGYVDGILDNIDDASRFPTQIETPNFQPNPGDPQQATQTPAKVPNYANSDCAWISIQPLSGAVQLDTVASEPTDQQRLSNYYGLSATPNARSVAAVRVLYSRRLASAGATQ